MTKQATNPVRKPRVGPQLKVVQDMKNQFPYAVGVLTALLASSASAAGWGHLSGTIVFDGDPTDPAAIQVNKDHEVCGKHNLKDPTLRIDPDTKGIANCVIYVYLAKKEKIDIHENYEADANAQITLDNLNCEFVPHVALVRIGQTLLVGNKDSVGHNTKIDTGSNPPKNPIVPAGGQFKQKYTKVERRPVPVGCNIHGWMSAWLVIKDNPYMAVTDEQGNFEIKNLPVGDWSFQFWHERAGYLSKVKLDGKAESWKKGRPELSIEEGDNDLGTIAVSAELFEK